MRKSIVLGVVFLVLILYSRTAEAHKVSLFAYHENGVVHTEAYFVDGTPCRNAKVTATDVKGTVIADGVTDDKGMFSFPYSANGDLTLTVNASLGHRSEILLKAAEPEIAEAAPAQKKTALPGPDGNQVVSGNHNIDEAAVERIVDEKIRPIDEMIREIQKNQDRPTFGKILGGLGWIMGLAGAFMWGMTRGKNRV